MADKNRLEELYQKYMDRTSTDPEIKELFDLIRESGDLAALRKVLKHRWDTQEIDEELTSLSWETIQHEMTPNQGKTKKSRSLILRLSIAASVLIVVGIATWTWMHREMITTYETGYGEVEEIVLNDNSRVRLNANSKLYWDTNWERRGDRNVRIEGEAFFDVAHLDGNRFYVSTEDLTVMVTGTAFNVASRGDNTKVYLESGEVFLKLNRDDETEVQTSVTESTTAQKEIKMLPGEQLSYSSASKSLEQKDNLTVEQAASWKTGELIFKNIPLHEVLQELSYVYGKSFVVEDSTLFERKIDVGMPYSDWETVKDLMQFMIDVKLTETKNKVTIK